MNWTVSFRARAQNDLREAFEWYAAKQSGLGDEFLVAASEVFLQLEESPERYPLYYSGFRRALLFRFPYKIFFRIESQVVIVFRILHASRDHPSELQNP